MSDEHNGFQTQPARVRSRRTREKAHGGQSQEHREGRGEPGRDGRGHTPGGGAGRPDGGEREALSGPGPAGSRVRLVTVPSRPVPSHAAPPVIRHPMNERPSRLTSRGPAQVLHLKREARPGPEASCPGNASLRHLRSFSPSPIHQPRGGGAKDPAPPPSADWIASCSRALLPSLIGWKAHQSSFPPVLFLLLLEVYASG